MARMGAAGMSMDQAGMEQVMRMMAGMGMSGGAGGFPPGALHLCQ